MKCDRTNLVAGRPSGRAIMAAGSIRFLIVCLLIFRLAAIPDEVGAKSAGALMAAGNKLFSEGKYDQAMCLYQRAQSRDTTAEINFNEGDVYFKTGDYTAAAKRYETAALSARGCVLKSKCHFKLGSAYFRQAEAARQIDLQKAIALYDESARHYMEAYQLDPGLKQAGENLERVRAILESLSKRATPSRRETKPETTHALDPKGQNRPPEPQACPKGQQTPRRKQRMPGGQDAPRARNAKPDQGQTKESPPTGRRFSRVLPPDRETPSLIFREEMENRAHMARSSHFATHAVQKDW